jgi:hypothetical protein
MFIYAGGVLGAVAQRDIVLPADELRSWVWCSEAKADQRLSELLGRRVRAALQASGGRGDVLPGERRARRLRET